MTNIAEMADDARRVDKAIRLRTRGAHWGEVAEACGYPSPAAALKAVGEAMQAAVGRAEMTADQMRDEAELRLTSLLGSTLAMLDEDAPETYDADGNPLSTDDRAVKLRAVDEARRIVVDLAKIQGVDKPSKDAGEGDDVLKIQLVGLDPKDLV